MSTIKERLTKLETSQGALCCKIGRIEKIIYVLAGIGMLSIASVELDGKLISRLLSLIGG